MRRLLQLALFSLLSLPMFAACHAVSASGAGSHTGADWNNSYAGIPGTLTRGDIYYFADGSYGSYEFSQADSGSTIIEFRKAQSYDNGSSCSPSIAAGWNTSTMGAAQAIFTSSGEALVVNSDYFTLNGNGTLTASGCGGAPGTTVSASPPTPSDCGFKTVGTGGETTVIELESATHVTLEHIELLASGTNNDSNFEIFQGGVNFSLLYSYLHNSGTVYMQNISSNSTVDHTYFWGTEVNCSGSCTAHGQAEYVIPGTNNGVRSNNVYRDIAGTAVWTFGEGPGTTNNWEIYNNVIMYSSPQASWKPSTSDAAFDCINSQTCTNIFYIQNTIINCPNPSTTSLGVSACGLQFADGDAGSSVTIENNLYYGNYSGTTNFSTNSTTVTEDYNSFLNSAGNFGTGAHDVIVNSGAANPFVNWPSSNFNLSVDGANYNNRKALSSPYTVDVNGTTFTTDRGAYQFTGGTSYTLSVPVTGSGSVSSSPSGIAGCTAVGGTCSASFSSGTVVTLTQTASATYYPFQSWSGACSGSGACSVTMSAAESVGAEFCGPPNYPCSTVGTFISQTPNAAPFSGGTGYNQVRYDLSGLNAVPLNPLVRITDATMLSGRSPSSTFSGGDNDWGWSCTGRADLSSACGAASLYYYAATSGGGVFFEGIKYIGGVPQVVAPFPPTASALFSPQGAPAFASTDPATLYEEIGATGTAGGIPAIKKVVLSWSGVVGQSPTFVESSLYNFAASCSVLPNGYAFGEQYSGGLSHDSTDNIFGIPVSNVRPVSGTTATATVGNGSTSVTFTTSAIGSAVIHSGAACTSCTYALGDVVTVTQAGASGGKLVITGVSSGTPTSIAVWTIGTLYSTASSLSTTGGSGSGLQVDITNGMLTDSSYDGAQVTLNGVSGTYRIVSNTLTGFTISPAFSGTGCATSCTMTIQGGQGSGHWILAYQISPAACAVYNTNTGLVSTAGAFPTGGTIDTGCTGMLVHDGFLFHSGAYGQWSGASTGTSCGTASTFWETGTTHAVPCTGTITGGNPLCEGHNTFGFNNEVAISNPSFVIFPPSAANSGTPYSPFGSIPLTGGSINCENHFSWQNVDANDTYPVIGATSNVNYSSSGSTSTWGYPTMNEVYVLQQNGTLTRIAHNFILGSSTLCGGGVGPFSAYFNAGEAIGVASQDGTMFAFSSDMLGQLGLDASSATRADIFVVGLDQMAGSSTIFTGPAAPSFAKMPEPAHEPDPRLIRISKPN